MGKCLEDAGGGGAVRSVINIYSLVFYIVRATLSDKLRKTPNCLNQCTVVQITFFTIFYKMFSVVYTWRAAGQSMMTSAACLSARLALCSPSAAMTLALASLAASASAAMARWSCSGTRTSFTSTRSTCTPHGSVASSSVA